MMQLFKLNTSLHKWLSLLIGVQLLIWLGTGLYFNLMDSDKARGNEFRQSYSQKGNLADFELIKLDKVSEDIALEVNLIWILHQPYYHAIYEQGEHSYQKYHAKVFDAVTGQPFELSKQQALMIAQNTYSGDGQLAMPMLVQPLIADYVRQQNPMWQVAVNDENNTTIYLDGLTGKVLRHVNDDSRLKDLMMKLHFMDYGNSGGFNHWLIIAFAIGCLLLSITGVTWLVQLYQNGLLSIKWSRKSHRISVSFTNQGTSSDVSATKSATVLDGLAASHVFLPSSCGGGGTCGKCVFLSTEKLPITLSEKEHLSAEQLDDGYRLGCQHKCSDVHSIAVNIAEEIETHELVVTATRFITPFIKEVKFKTKSGKRLSYRAGAYMQFNVPAGMTGSRPNNLPEKFEKYWSAYEKGTFSHESVTRHYSLANFDQESDELTFNIRWQTSENGIRAGIGSSYLGSLQVGDTITATGPYSEFYAPSVNKDNKIAHRMFIGAGSGLAPLKSILFEQLKKHQSTIDMTLIYGARSEDDLLYLDELQLLEKQHHNFTYVNTLTRPSEHWQGHTGYVQNVLATHLEQLAEPLTTEAYLCGPSAMMVDVEKVLVEAGVPKEQIFSDKFTR